MRFFVPKMGLASFCHFFVIFLGVPPPFFGVDALVLVAEGIDFFGVWFAFLGGGLLVRCGASS
jgi:hypothetical protein